MGGRQNVPVEAGKVPVLEKGVSPTGLIEPGGCLGAQLAKHNRDCAGSGARSSKVGIWLFRARAITSRSSRYIINLAASTSAAASANRV